MGALFTNKLSQINVQTSSNTAKQLNLTENQVGACASISVCSHHLFSLSRVAELSSLTTIIQLSQRSLYHRALGCFCARFYHRFSRLVFISYSRFCARFYVK